MGFYPFHISVAIITYVVLGGFTVFFGMFSLLIREKLYLGESIVAFLFGVIIGPYGANIFNPRQWGDGSREVVQSITLEITRVVLAVGVFAIGVELPSKYMQKHWKSLVFLLLPIMSIGWVICAGLIYALIPRLDFMSSLAIAACLTPTDPILAAAVINGRYAEKHVPEHIRHLLSAESGSNDGAAFPFLFISLYVILEADDRVAVAHWFYITWLYEILLGITIGGLIGYGFRHLMKFCESRDLIDRHSYVAQYISLALLSNGITALLGSDDLLAAFASGVAFAWDSHFNKQTADSVFSAVIDLLFNVAIFVFIGAWMPFNNFSNEDTSITVWRLVVLAILVLLLRRLPVMLLLYRWIPDIRTFREALFSGHFGPMGVGAIFIATLALEKLPHPHEPPSNQTDVLALAMEPIIAFMVMCSILTHGLSIPFFNLGRRVQSLTIPRTLSLRGHHEPEWAGQTIKVTRPEDIVVNRDHEPATTTITEKEMEEGRAALTTSSSEGTRKPEDGEVTPLEEGGVEVREWREGRHLVREYRPKDPGGEVRVEVIRDAYADSGNPNLDAIKATFTVAESAIKDEVRRYLGSFSQRPSLDDSASRSSKRKGPEIEEQRVGLEHDDEADWEDEPSSEAEGAGKKIKRPSSPRGRRHGGRNASIRRTALGAARNSRHASVDDEATNTPIVTVPSLPGGSSGILVRTGTELTRTDSRHSSPSTPNQPQPRYGSTAIDFIRTDSISSVRSGNGGDRVARLRLREGGADTPNVRSRDSSPSRGVRFELSQPPSQPSLPHPHAREQQQEPDPNPQRASALKPLRR
ncbi:Na(+)/H(+) antiporter [Serendipita indica DSM 11827]|nr:Na(+)/H(+) antiporter [Serendipita indica DSM 11827]